MNEILHNALKDFHIEDFQKSLVNWYEAEKRDLPWRRTNDPYKIWVSEVMLQQTRVDTVIPYYNRFLEKFPTLQDFAEAQEDEILKAWEGLGYYSRVRNLQSAVREVAEIYEGRVPENIDEFQALKGVGPYTAGAVMSIAFNKPEPAVDGNVMRVFSRIFSIEEDIAKPKTRKLFEELVKEVIDPENPSPFNQGIMELGALICTPQAPSCLLCPVREHCKGFHEGKETMLPIKQTKKKIKNKKWIAAIVMTDTGEFVIRKRPRTGLLASMWEYPNWERDEGDARNLETFRLSLKEELGMDIQTMEPLTTVKHVFSHVEWEMDAYVVKGLLHHKINSPYLQVQESQLAQYAFPVPFQKMWEAYKNTLVNSGKGS
ncbi:A/G-specific DNA-adenine glycosylase [Bacillus oleivorans]|uniref:Adenine DNA glycosylase n=1 Tax=Bacillus oleivorans TaxID=1448271 RepID=A0A285CTM9_9BACI|nr:A/G-specific adenine glycosylase [Bacillus oleivorans]SNX70313.1 A/G-specific DNA-adenine glycosylase [Bacillus oleivorans]